MPDRSNSVSSPRTARFARILTIGSGAVAIAALASDQVNLFIAEAHDVPCFSLPTWGSTAIDHAMRAAPFVLILATNALSWRQAGRWIFMVCNAVALALSLLYLCAVSLNWPLIPAAGDCTEDLWDDYGMATGYFQFFVMWPLAVACCAVFGLSWIGRSRD